MNPHDQVAGGAAVLARVALAPQGDGLAVVDTGGDADGDPLGLFHAAAAAAGLAGAVDDLAGPPAAGAGGRWLEKAKPPVRCCTRTTPVPLAVGAGLRRGPGLTAGAVAGLALLAAVQVDLLLAAEGGLLKR